MIFAGFWDATLEESLKKVIIEHKSDPEGTELGDRLTSLVRMGIPSFLRGYAWGLFLGHDAEKASGIFKVLSTQTAAIQSAKSTGSQEKKLLHSYSAPNPEMDALTSPSFPSGMFQWSVLLLSKSQGCCSEQTVEQINKDLDRTFPGHPLMDATGKDSLRQILIAFALHRPDIGYCQVITPLLKQSLWRRE